MTFLLERRNITKIILEYDMGCISEIYRYSFEHILSHPNEQIEIKQELILEIANPKERMEILTKMGFVEYLNDRIDKLAKLPKCENKTCNKQGKMVKCKGCNKLFCNSQCQKKHHKGKNCVTFSKV